MTTRHEVLVAITVDARRVRLARDREEPVDDALADAHPRRASPRYRAP